jgi:hypothetical protein
MNPTVELTTPFIDPAYVTRAISTGEMFTVAVSSALNVVYELGIPTTWVARGAIRNNTMSHRLSVVLAVPTFIALNIPLTFILETDEVSEFDILLNEETARTNGHSVNRLYSDNLGFTVEPLAVASPVYVRTNLGLLVV